MAAPTVTGIDPGSGPAGTLVTITGTGFTDDASAVMFGAVSAGTRFSVVSDTQMLAYAPAGTGTVSVKVTTPGGVGTVGSDWAYDAYVGPPGGGGGSAPTVTSVVPDSAVDNDGGDVVVVNGTGFTTTLMVFFGSAQANFSVDSDTALTVITPAGSDVVDVTVVNSYGTSAVSAADEFTYPLEAVPTVTVVYPEGGYPNTKVTITGTGFTRAHAVLFGTESAPFSVDSDTSITAYAPDSSGAVHVTVDNTGGTSTETAADVFTYGAGGLPLTVASDNVNPNGFEGWEIGDQEVTLTAFANGGYGVAKTYYTLGVGGVTEYSGPFAVTGAGSHMVRYWSVDIRGNVEPVNTGWVNILSASAVPTGLALTPGIGFILAAWDSITAARPVTYRVYIGSANPPLSLYVSSSSNIASIRVAASDGLVYVAVSSVDVAGNESAKCTAASATAIAAAADLADHAISQAKLALNIRPPFLSAAAPALPDSDFPIGSTYFNTTDKHLYKTTDGTTWGLLVDAGDIVANTITAGQIAAGAIGADEIAANSIFAKNLVVANFENLIPNGNSEADISGAPAGAWEAVGVTSMSFNTGTKCRRIIGADDPRQEPITDLIPVTPGSEYYLAAYGKESSGQGNPNGSKLSVNFYNGAGTYLSTVASTLQQTTTWTDRGFVFAAPTNAVSMQVNLWCWSAIGIASYYDELCLRRRNDGNLIVDGAITADKIAANVITAAKIAANTITAAEIAAGTITATEIDTASLQADIVTAAAIAAVDITAANITGGTITGTTITGGTIQSAASGARVVVSAYGSTDKISLYDSSGNHSDIYEMSGNLYLSEEQVTVLGSLSVTGALIAGSWVSAGSDDGIWIQDRYTIGGRWKLTFDSNNKKLYVQDGTSGYTVQMA